MRNYSTEQAYKYVSEFFTYFKHSQHKLFHYKLVEAKYFQLFDKKKYAQTADAKGSQNTRTMVRKKYLKYACYQLNVQNTFVLIESVGLFIEIFLKMHTGRKRLTLLRHVRGRARTHTHAQA